MEKQTLPTPPTEEECRLYYYGLPYCPRLVARSSTHVWEIRQLPLSTSSNPRENMVPKALAQCPEHPAYHLWFDPACSLRGDIVQAVTAANATDWVSIDLIGIRDNDGFNTDFVATLMVTVKPGKVSWSAGYAIARQCKSILEAHNILDVECEIRESIVRYL
ncbi:hypothetical protein V8C34DRAFT_326768 [Trichoderma compactum]